MYYKELAMAAESNYTDSETVDLFYSYAKQDESLRLELEKHLSGLRRKGIIRELHDHLVLPGSDQAQTIDTFLNTAAIILLLISPDFLASDFCYNTEMQLALERHKTNEARVIPVLIRPVYWSESPFAKLQCL